MAGGFDAMRTDTLAGYSALRRMTYDIDLAPLPNNLPLSASDEALNRRAGWRVKRNIEHVSI